MSPLVEMIGISRRFSHITALSDIDLSLFEGEVLALLGDNGAGKSTLIKVLTGVHQPTSGRIRFDGREVQITSPNDAHDLGIETVYQDLALIPRMSIARNFFLGREITRRLGPFVVLDREQMQSEASDALSEIGIDIRDADEPVGTLSGGISEALITTKFGLIVAIPSLLLHAFLSRKARAVIGTMEMAAVAFANQVSRTAPRIVAEGAEQARKVEAAPPDPELVQKEVRKILGEILGPMDGGAQPQQAK